MEITQEQVKKKRKEFINDVKATLDSLQGLGGFGLSPAIMNLKNAVQKNKLQG